VLFVDRGFSGGLFAEGVVKIVLVAAVVASRYALRLGCSADQVASLMLFCARGVDIHWYVSGLRRYANEVAEEQTLRFR
jgi:hypothetical protein